MATTTANEFFPSYEQDPNATVTTHQNVPFSPTVASTTQYNSTEYYEQPHDAVNTGRRLPPTIFTIANNGNVPHTINMNSTPIASGKHSLLDINIKPDQHQTSMGYIVQAHNLRSFNLKFKGDSSVDDFLLQVDEIRLARNVDETTLVRGFTELLEGTALKFYRSIRSKICSWHDICHEFRSNFQSVDYNYSTEKEIREMKQKTGQSVFDFIVDLRDLNNKLQQPIPNTALLEIIKHNLLPQYAQLLAINSIYSFDQLIQISKNFEAYSGVLARDGIRDGMRDGLQANATTSNFSKKKQFNVVAANLPQRQTAKPVITCQKCKKIGHSYRQCKIIPGMVCFSCGLPNVINKTCPKCNSTTTKPIQKN